MTRSRKTTTRKRTQARKAPTLDIKSASDVKKALGIMKKHPLTIVLVFANWCPHCHTFMHRWNKLKGIPNRTSPMIAVEQQFSNDLLSTMSDESGKPPQIQGYPTLLASTNKGNTNVGVEVSTGDETALMNLAKNGNAVLNGNNNENSANMNTNNENSANMNTNNENEANMNTNNENEANMNTNNENSANMNTNNNNNFAASYSNESIPNNKKRRTAVKKSTSASKLSNAVRNAIENASTEAKSLKAKAAMELDSPFSRGSFASPPPSEGPKMKGGSCGGPSGLCRLSGGAQQKPTLYTLLKEFGNATTRRKTRK